MHKTLERVRKLFSVHSYETRVVDLDRVLDKAINPVHTDEQIVKIHEGKGVIIQFDSMLKPETIKLLREDIQKQIKENGFAVVDARCKIIEFDNPKYLIETK